jgi:phage baseplate assembly protein W
MDIAFPFYINREGLIAGAVYEDHIRQMIELVLFTAPGERVNRPDFGCGVDRLVFEAASQELVTATQALVQSELQRWLGDLIQVEGVSVALENSTLLITIRYIIIQTNQRRVDQFKQLI